MNRMIEQNTDYAYKLKYMENRIRMNVPPEEILKSVRKDIEAFVQDAEQFDDLTMLCLVYKGNGEQA